MGVLIDGLWKDEELPQETGGAGEFISGVILFDETIRQSGHDGTAFPKEGSILAEEQLRLYVPEARLV